MQALRVNSGTVGEVPRTPACPPKNGNAPLAIFVLPIDLRSFIVRVLNELLVDPAAPVVAAPDLS
jgi:hypothetical protein